MESSAYSGVRNQPRTPRTAACFACRERKSRCKLEDGSTLCLMCRSHDTRCIFPPSKQKRRARGRERSQAGETETSPSPKQARRAARAERSRQVQAQYSALASPGTDSLYRKTLNRDGNITEVLYSPEDESSNQRLVGPALESDSRALSSIFSSNLRGNQVMRTVWTSNPSGWSAPIVFTKSRKRPIGLQTSLNPAKAKLQLIEKFLEPWLSRLVELFLKKSNSGFPILDEIQFLKQYNTEKESISPALLSCLYAHAMIFWTSDPVLSEQRRPDVRFVWNIANEALYSELRLSPSILTLAAILLNISGRPTTLVFNNAGQLGFAISLAYTLGLNRDPSSWDIPEHEKQLRRNVWHGLLVYDRWSSLAYGIPPHIRTAHADVSVPSISAAALGGTATPAVQSMGIFADFFTLTELLHTYLEHMYIVSQCAVYPTAEFANRLQSWVDGTTGVTRRVILRGSNLFTPGAPNLRLAFLSVQFLHHRMALDAHRKECFETNILIAVQDYYLPTRRAAEEAVMFIQDLSPTELEGFWMPVLAFPLLSIMTFLARSAAEFEDTAAGLDTNVALTLATDLMESLRAHHANSEWDLGDLCLTQYEGILEQLQSGSFGLSLDSATMDALDTIMPNLLFSDTAAFMD